MSETGVGFVEMVTSDLRSIRVSMDKQDAKIEALQQAVTSLQLQEIQLLKIEMATLKAGALNANERAIERLASGQLWLSRLLIGALLTGMVGGVVALGFRLLG